jgi:DNA-binding winged helix-turn-helix (wHTH) protein/predicted ATPase
MQDEQHLHFEDYRLDLRNECAWRGTQAIHLTTKAFMVLRLLIEHAGQLVTKADLFAAVWPDTAVSDAALTTCIGEIRKALGDTAQAPRFVATVHRRGYRFLAPVALRPPGEPAGPPATPTAPPLAGSAEPQTPLLVGYETELARLHGCFATAQRGVRQLVFVTGEAGIGKTTVVDTFLASLATQTPCWVAWGQCLAQYGAGEAYLPVLDALGRLGRGPAAAQVLEWLRQSAPTWLLQLPALCPPAEQEALQRTVLGGTRERMLRELAEALDSITVERPLVLVLEDLHWSDQATLDLLTWLARRREPARLLVLGTYRPVDVIVHGHPLQTVKQELALHGQCVELRLEGLDATAVAAYLAQRLPGCAQLVALARVLYRRTDGHPLFIVQAVDTWLQHGWVAEVAGQWAVQVGLETIEQGVPESVRQLIEQQLAGLSTAEQQILEAASVMGESFAVPAVAAGVETPMEVVEERCVALVRHGQFLQARGMAEWPDGTVAERYAFRHALYQQVVYERLPVSQQVPLHRRLAARLERAYGEQAREIAAELARHWEQGRDAAQAVRYRRHAAEQALQRSAAREAIAHLTTALDLLATLPETMARLQEELALQLALGVALLTRQGYAASEVERTYTRVLALCQQLGDTAPHFQVLRGLWNCAVAQGQILHARERSEQLLVLAHRQSAPELLALAHRALGTTLCWQGEFSQAWQHLEQGRTLATSQAPHIYIARYGEDPGLICQLYAGLTLCALGYPDQAGRQMQEALRRAETLAHPFSLAFALIFAAWMHQHRQEAAQAQAQAEAAIALTTQHEIAQWWALGSIIRGWAVAMQGQGADNVGQLQESLAAYRATGPAGGTIYPALLAMLAEAAAMVGQIEVARAALEEALAGVVTTGERYAEAELYRLKGELLLQAGALPLRSGDQPSSEAEACFHEALEVARRQHARSYELRAARSLSRLWQCQGRIAAARELLAEVYGWFTEGLDTPDLHEAQTLLTALGG